MRDKDHDCTRHENSFDNPSCHICEVSLSSLHPQDVGFVMECWNCNVGPVPVCRRCIKDMVIRDLETDPHFSFEFIPSPELGGVILEAFSEVNTV